MKSMFLAFPGGSAGVGLLVLRLSLAGSLIVTLGSVDPQPWLLFLAIMTSIGLGAGFLTRLMAGISILAMASVIPESGAPALVILNLADAVALALIGPGAFSVDARLFGRRTVVLPASRDTIV
jgi:hypothetical protein